MRLTIGIDASRAFGDAPTGTERYSDGVIGGLVERAEHDLVLYVRRPLGAAAPEGAEVRLLRAKRLWTQARLAHEVALRPPDVLFVPAHVLPFVCRPPSVVTVHDLGHRAHPHSHTLGQRLYLEVGARWHVARADHLLADSWATRHDLIEHYAASPAKVTVAHLGVDATLRPASGSEQRAARARAGLPPDAPYFLHVGTLQPRKNLLLLVDAFARLTAELPGHMLVLAGRSGWGNHDPVGRARELGLGDKVVHVGYVDRDDLPGLYSGAVATVVPSLYEGFGLPALEAMACGSPVAASGASSLPEVIGAAGLLFDALDMEACAAAMLRLAGDSELRRNLGEQGIERARLFTWSRCTDTVQAVLEGVASAARPVRPPARRGREW